MSFISKKLFIYIMNDGDFMNQFKIISILGKGIKGTVFLVEDKEKQQYALKIEQIDQHDLDSEDSQVKKEIEFSDHFSNQYPTHFMKILSYNNDKCDYVHTLSDDRWKIMSKKEYDYYQTLFKSKYCSIKLSTIVDTTLFDVMYDISNPNIINSLLIQVLYIAYVIQLDGYMHRDFKPKNIGIVYTKDKYVMILDKKIPTNGMILQAIDYGNVIHKSYKHTNDFYVIFEKFILKMMLKHITEQYPHIDVSESVSIHKEYRDKLKPYIYSKNKKFFEQILYKIIFFKEYKKNLKIDESIELFEFMKLSQLKYLIKHCDDLHKILMYLIKIY
jgi:serine/threonine protein kinase